MAATEPIRNKKQIKELGAYYFKRGQLRNYLLIVLGIHTALRISDLLRLQWEDVYDFKRDEFHAHIHIKEQKTGKTKAIALNKQAIAVLKLCFYALKAESKGFLFKSNRKDGGAIGRTQAWRIIREAALAVGLHDRISCHSLRKTLGYHAWKSGVSAVVLMDIYNHSSYAVTRRYLGITQDDRDKVYLNINLL